MREALLLAVWTAFLTSPDSQLWLLGLALCLAGCLWVYHKQQRGEL